MRVYDTPNGRFITSMDVVPKKCIDECEIYTISDLDTVIDIIRSGCGDDFANDFRKIMDDLDYFNSETLEDAIVCAMEAEIEDRDLENDTLSRDLRSAEKKLKSAEKHLSDINAIVKSLQKFVMILSFGQAEKYKDLIKDLNRIEKLSEI